MLSDIAELGMLPLQRRHQPVGGVDVGLGRGDDDVGVGSLAVDDHLVLLQAYRDLALGIGAAGDVVHRVERQFRTGLHQCLDGLEGGIHGSGAGCRDALLLAVDGQHHVGGGRLAGFGADTQRNQLDARLVGLVHGFGDQGLQILVEDFVLLVRQRLEAGKGLVEFFFRVELDAQLPEPGAKGVAPGVLAQHHAVVAPAHVLGAHDLVGFTVLEHAVLVDARLVGKGVGPHDGLVRLYRKTGDAGDQLGAGHDLGSIEIGVAGEDVLAGTHRHHHLLQCGVAGPFPQAVDGALHLARAIEHRGKGVGHRQPQVVVAVHGKDRLVRVGHPLEELADGLAELVRQVVAHGIRDVDGAGAGIDGRLHDAAEKVHLRTPGILGGELHVVGVTARALHRPDRLFHHLVGRHAQLLFHVDGRDGDEGVDARPVRGPERLAGAVYILFQRPRQTADGGVLNGFGHRLHRFEIALAGDGKTGLDDIHLHQFQFPGDADLLLASHGSARALLAVAQGGVEYDQFVSAHDVTPPGAWQGRGVSCLFGICRVWGPSPGRENY